MEEKNTRRPSSIALIILTGIAILAALKACQGWMLPIVLAIFAYFLLGPLLDKLDRAHVPHILGVFICFIVLLFFMLLSLWIFYKTVSMLIGEVPVYNDRLLVLDAKLTTWLSKYIELENDSLLSILPIDWAGFALNGLSMASSQIVGILKMMVLVMLYVLFMLFERKLFTPKLYAAFSRSSRGPMVVMMTQRISRQVSKYLLLKAVISLFTGGLFYLTAFVAGMSIPLLYGVLAFIFNFIPSIGSIIVTILTSLMCLLQFAPTWTPVVFVFIMTVSIEMVLGNIIDPKLQGGQLNLSPVFILISLALWGYIWGIVGMFIAVPLTCCCEVICANIKELKPVAIILSGGRSFTRRSEQERNLRKKTRRSRKKGTEEGEQGARAEIQKADVILPDDFFSSRKKKS